MSDLSSFFGQQAFDGRGVEAQEDAEFIPAGKYPVIITKTEVKSNKKQDGHLIALEMQILDGPFKGRAIRDWINIDNPNQQCVEIGMRCLEALRQAIGLTAISDTNQLLQQTVIAHVKVKDNQNSVRTYSSAAQQQVAVAPVAAPVVYTAASVPAPAVAPAPALTPGTAVAPAPALTPGAFQAPAPTGGVAPPPWATR